MAEYIEREVVLKELNKNSITKKITFANGVSIFDTIKNIPTADVVEVKHGEWIKDNNFSQIVNKYKCSLCGVEDIVLHHNYCPNCGAKMDLKEGAEE